MSKAPVPFKREKDEERHITFMIWPRVHTKSHQYNSYPMKHYLWTASTALAVASLMLGRTRPIAASFVRSLGTASVKNHNSVGSRRCRPATTQCSASIARTQYTLDDNICPPTRPQILSSVVSKACATLDIFLERKPIAPHTQKAFDSVFEQVGPNPPPIILDSGCGTGRSTKLLSQLYPDHLVIGVDRSFARLTKTKTTLWNADEDEDNSEESSSDASIELETSEDDSKRPFGGRIAENAYLVRAELVDFWRCCHQQRHWNIAHHYLLYPNPYPTHTRLTQRWYAHPSFPLILKLGAKSITIRSNWEGYLKEFARAVEIADEYYTEKEQLNPARCYMESARMGPVRRTDLTVAWTNFEKKYDVALEPTYELKLEAR